MAYLERWDDVRRDPRLLLEGARTLIVCAFPYYNKAECLFSKYAVGRDYHEVVRERLGHVAAAVTAGAGAACRVCVDTAPLRERYWAVRAGLGFIGLNNQLIIPGLGSYFFLGTIVTTLGVVKAPPLPRAASCLGCGRCVEACPGRALDGHGGLDARRCLSYLTIERRGELPPGALERASTVYGCDVCQRVCPHNADAVPTPIADFGPCPEVEALGLDDIIEMTPSRFRHLFAHSAVRRAGLGLLRRNALAMTANGIATR